MGRFVILSGPSCVGKGPLVTALRRFHPELAEGLQMVVLSNSRAPRPSEKDGRDYHFRRREEIEALRKKDNFVVMDVRGDLQALDLEELGRTLETGDAFFEGNPFVGQELLRCPVPDGVERVTAFLSPLSKEELTCLRDETHADLPGLVTEVMRRKLLRRTSRQKGHLSLPDLQEIERRASSAYNELKLAWQFGPTIVNHDGEDSENWNAFYYPLGDARGALAAFADLLAGREPRRAERWSEDMLP
ncbi:MAG: hypothetical protein R6X33_05790 [Candidatus Brocadiia bacterium]